MHEQALANRAAARAEHDRLRDQNVAASGACAEAAQAERAATVDFANQVAVAVVPVVAAAGGKIEVRLAAAVEARRTAAESGAFMSIDDATGTVTAVQQNVTGGLAAVNAEQAAALASIQVSWSARLWCFNAVSRQGASNRQASWRQFAALPRVPRAATLSDLAQ